jgi:hypothetical protein
MAVIEHRMLDQESPDAARLAAQSGLAGLVGTTAATAFLAVAPRLGLVRLDAPRALGRWMQHHVVAGTVAQLGAWFAWFALGAVLAIGLGWFLARYAPARGASMGSAFGVALWALVQVVLLPSLGMGAFGLTGPAGVNPANLGLATLLAAVVYGVAAGAVFHVELVRSAPRTVEVTP